MFGGGRSSRFPRSKGRYADPSNMARTMDIFGISIPPKLGTECPISEAQNNGKEEQTSPVQIPPEESSNKRGRTSPEPPPNVQSNVKRGLIRIVTGQEMANLKVFKALPSSSEVLDSRRMEGIPFVSRTPVNNLKEVSPSGLASDSVIFAASPSVMPKPCASTSQHQLRDTADSATQTSQNDFVEGGGRIFGVVPTPVSSLDELLKPLLEIQNDPIKKLTISAELLSGDTFTINGDMGFD